MFDLFTHTLSVAAFAVFVVMLGTFVISLVRRDSSIAHIVWGPLCVVAILAVLWGRDVVVGRQILITVLVAVWGLRLGFHVLLRNWGRGEDFRYARGRKIWGQYFPLRAFLQVFIGQGLVLLIIMMPALWTITFDGPVLGWLDWFGTGIWLLGFLCESVADHQLVRFLKEPANEDQVLQLGLWRYSRHPNYFGEVLEWWGIWLIALSVPGGWFTVAGPLVVTVLLLKVSVPSLEARQMQNSEFKAYAERTNALVPWFPRD